MEKRIKGNRIGPLQAPDFPYGPGGPGSDEGDKIKLPPLSAPDLPHGPGGPGLDTDKPPIIGSTRKK